MIHQADIEEFGGTNKNNMMDLFNIYTKVFIPNRSTIFNSFIRGFGAKFDTFDDRQLVRFCSELSSAGLA